MSFAGRVQLVKSYITFMLVHSFTIYSWPKSLIKELKKNIKNFIWVGDISKTKLVIVAWDKMCKPLEQGRICPRSISTLNEAFNMKL